MIDIKIIEYFNILLKHSTHNNLIAMKKILNKAIKISNNENIKIMNMAFLLDKSYKETIKELYEQEFGEIKK